MQIHQLIYTKASKDDSPWNKNGYQTLGYSTDFMSRKEVLEIENRIHFPGQDVFEEKRVVFYQPIKGKEYLVILYLRSLPDTKDEFGRAGMFIAHGFIFPQEIWADLSGPLDLAPLVEKHVIRSREDAIAYDKMDLKTGNLAPLEIPDADLKDRPSPPPPQMGETSKRLFFILYKIAMGMSNDLALIIRGNPLAIETVLNQLFAKMPSVLKSKLGWDSGFDGGKIFFSKLRVFGYSDMAPTTGKPIQFNLDKNAFQQDEQYNRFSSPQSWFERWIARSTAGHFPVKVMDRMYELSEFLDSRNHQPPSLEDIPEEFINSNRNELIALFEQKAVELLPSPWAREVSSHQSATWILESLLQLVPATRVAEGLEHTILQKNLDPGKLKAKFPKGTLGVGSHALQLIGKIWDKEKLEYKDYERTSPDNPTAFFRWLSNSKWSQKDWVFMLISHVPEMFKELSDNAAFRADVEEWAVKQIGKPFKGLARPLAKQMIRDGAMANLVKGDLDWVSLLDGYLRSMDWTPREAEKMVNLGKKLKINRPECNLFHNFVFPGDYIDPEIGGSPGLREKYLANLIQNHGMKEKELLNMGWDQNEVGIGLATHPHGIMHKVGRSVRKIVS